MTTDIDAKDDRLADELRLAFAELARATVIDTAVHPRRGAAPPRGTLGSRWPVLAAAAAVALTVGGLVAVRALRTGEAPPVAAPPAAGTDDIAPVFPDLGPDGTPEPSYRDPAEAAAAYLAMVAGSAPRGIVATFTPGTTTVAGTGVDATTAFQLAVARVGGEITDTGDGTVTLGRARDGSWYVTAAGIPALRIDRLLFVGDTVTGVFRAAIGGEYQVTIEGDRRRERTDGPFVVSVVPTLVRSGATGSFTATDVVPDAASVLIWQTPGADVRQPTAMFAHVIVREGSTPVSVDFGSVDFGPAG